MIHSTEELHFENAVVHSESWLVEGSRFHVIGLHGLGNSPAVTRRLAKHFYRAGVSFHSFDLPGFGMSKSMDGNMDLFESYTGILDRYIMAIRKRYKAREFILAGVSMGALIALSYKIVSKNKRVKGIIAVSAPYGAKYPRGLTYAIAWAICRIHPNFKLRYWINGASEPLRFSIKLGHDMIMALKLLESKMADINVPVLFLHGIRDSIANLDKLNAVAVKTGFDVKLYNTGHWFYGRVMKSALDDTMEWLGNLRDKGVA